MPITATIISSNHEFRARLFRCLNQARSFHCVGSYDSVRELRRCCACAPADIVLLDGEAGSAPWLQSIAEARSLSPTVQVVVLLPSEDVPLILQALAKGACGYWVKTEPLPQVLRLLEEIQRGASPVSGVVARRLVAFLQQQTSPWQNVDQLSLREKEILDFLARGYPYKQIAGHLAISINTVRTYVRRLYAKLRVPCRAQAVLKCQPTAHLGLLPAPTTVRPEQDPLAA